jgi:hypothetical protein
MATTVESLIESFPHPTVPSIEGPPTYESITDILQILNANAASVHSELGGGALGHLSLTVSTAVYATLSATPFVAPTNPGPTPAIPPRTTVTETNNVIRNHREELRIWREYQNVDAALKQQLINAIAKIYLRTLQHRHTGFANVTTRQLISHLLQTYGNITPSDLATNDQKFRSAYDPAQPIEHLFSQIEDTMDFADAGGSPYTTAQVLTNSYSLVFNTGLLPESCREWRRRPAAEQTWTNFKEQFAEAHQDLRLTQNTTQGAGYHNANNAMDSFVNDTAEAFANLATATASDRQMLADLTTTNKEITKQLATKDAEITQLKAKIQDLQRNRNPRDSRNRGSRDDRRDTTTRRYNNSNYCWTHGHDIAPNHTSHSCQYPGDGHQRFANKTDTKGGSDSGKSRVA